MILNKKTTILTTFTVVLISFHVFLYVMGPKLPKIQYRYGVTGLAHRNAKHFVYFSFYKNYFPIAIVGGKREYSEAGATNLLEKAGKRLVMEYSHWSRLGENARIFAYYPNAWMSGAKVPSVSLFNSISFVLGLLIILFAFSRAKQLGTGILAVSVFSLTPYFQYEIYSHQNIFGLLAAVGLIVIGLHIMVIKGNRNFLFCAIVAIISGSIVAFFSEIRGEIVVVLITASLIYVMSIKRRPIIMIISFLLLISSFFCTRVGIRNYFDYKFKEAQNIVAQYGGHVYKGGRITQHTFWHPVFCGLGDFDRTKGYRWQDQVAYRYALPILKKKYGIEYPFSGKFHLDAYYDEQKVYYRKFDEIPEYEPIIKEKVLSDILQDPLWYFTIIKKRVLRILSNTLPFPYAGWLILPLLIIILRKKDYFAMKILISSLPFSLTPLIIHSGHNNTFNSLFPIFTVIFLLKYALSFTQSKNMQFKLKS